MLQVKLVTPITYVTMFQGIFISQKMTLSPGDKQRPLTCVAIAAGKNCPLAACLQDRAIVSIQQFGRAQVLRQKNLVPS